MQVHNNTYQIKVVPCFLSLFFPIALWVYYDLCLDTNVKGNITRSVDKKQNTENKHKKRRDSFVVVKANKNKKLRDLSALSALSLVINLPLRSITQMPFQSLLHSTSWTSFRLSPNDIRSQEAKKPRNHPSIAIENVSNQMLVT